jgi:hypothetical protein
MNIACCPHIEEEEKWVCNKLSASLCASPLSASWFGGKSKLREKPTSRNGVDGIYESIFLRCENFVSHVKGRMDLDCLTMRC